MKFLKKSALFFCFFTSALFIAGCASDGSDKVNHTEWCRNKYEKAEALYKDGKYGRVQEKLEEILSLCAGTGYMEQSQFLLAESFFNLEEWIEARGEYASFVLNFPGSPFVETAEFRKAISSFKMEFKIARDEANTNIAMKDFERYLSNYPDSPLRDSVNYYYGLLIDRKAEKEFQTAKLYSRMDKPQATVIYLKEFLDVYKNTKRRKEAIFLIVDSYIKLDQFNDARNYLSLALQEFAATDNNIQNEVENRQKDISNAEVNFEKRIKKDAEKKRIQKEEAEMVN